MARALYIGALWLGAREDQYPGDAAAMIDLLRRCHPLAFSRMAQAVHLWERAKAHGFEGDPGAPADAADVYSFLVGKGERDLPIFVDAKVVPLPTRREPPAGDDAA